MPRSPKNFRRRLARAAMAGMALGATLAPQLGCGREFFRHWADQDVSEAVFEKTRDPRWRMDRLTIEPPALARFANPYDQDRQPAPPDDPAASALSPTPQFPYHQLLVPAEGTGYVDYLERCARYVTPTPDPVLPNPTPPPGMNGNNFIPPPGPSGIPPFVPGGNFGPDFNPLTPNPLGTAPLPPGEPAAALPTSDNRARPQPKDKGVLQAAFQTPGTAPAQPGTAPAAGLGVLGVQEPVAPIAPTARERTPVPEQDRIKLPAPTLDPGGRDPVDINTVPIPRLEPGRRADRGGSSGFQAQLSPVLTSFNEALASGFPSDSRPYVITPAEALQLGLMNSRAYQFRLENVYVQALAVTLSRFGFQPNFYAGFAPQTGGSNGIGIPNNTTNNFNYRTKETIGGQNSTLSLGSAAGLTKFLSFGGRFAAGFANQTIFNFLSNNPSQPDRHLVPADHLRPAVPPRRRPGRHPGAADQPGAAPAVPRSATSPASARR